jgi:hypothetical protein
MARDGTVAGTRGRVSVELNYNLFEEPLPVKVSKSVVRGVVPAYSTFAKPNVEYAGTTPTISHGA